MKRDVPAEIDEAFYAGKMLPALPFVANDSVDVVRGPHRGRGGAVISIEAMSPNPRLLVELEDGTDAVLDASSLRLVATGP